MITEIIIILCLIVLNGFLSASEIAIVSSRKARLQAESDKNNQSAKIALKLKQNPNQFLSTVQIGITLIGILTGFFSGGSISTFLAEQFNTIPFLAPYSNQLAVALVVLLITYLSLVIGELVPKRIGMAIPEKYSMLIAYPMQVLSKIVRPFVWALSIATDFIVKILNIKVSKNTVTEEEIKALVDEGVEGGVIDDFEHDFVDRGGGRGKKKAINLMIHRSEIDCLDLEDSFEENKNIILSSSHTEYPVISGNFDNVKGVIHVKSFLQRYMNNQPINLEELITPVPYVNENSYAYNVLNIFKNSKALLAIVIDEYGIPQGMITLKDIVATLMGNHEGLNSPEEPNFRQREDGSYIADGIMQVDDFMENLVISLSEEETEEINNVTTLGGLVFLLLDHIPAEGDTVTFKGYKLEVIDMDGHRIDKVAIHKLSIFDTQETENID